MNLKSFLITFVFVYTLISLAIALGIGYSQDYVPDATLFQKFKVHIIDVPLDNFLIKVVIACIMGIVVGLVISKWNTIFILFIVLIFFIISPPILAPILHNDDSPRSAIRNYIQNAGHPYQSFFAVIEINGASNKKDEYYVLWNDWDDVADHSCDANKSDEDTYKISCSQIVPF
ncbi:hypothetical protein [Paenisporosarcina indica]|uniref:hypothetical protein n=1 Tax=Paenisporosarcina indica TaxID=650093 RepID=UPI000A644B86|nr:hypothetical protein [Paenisporosarcina indica]